MLTRGSARRGGEISEGGSPCRVARAGAVPGVRCTGSGRTGAGAGDTGIGLGVGAGAPLSGTSLGRAGTGALATAGTGAGADVVARCTGVAAVTADAAPAP